MKIDMHLNRVPFDIDNELKKALQYHQSGQLPEAEEIYKKILEVDSRHSDALHLLGVLSRQTGNMVEAENLISKAIQNNPNVPLYYQSLGDTFQIQRKMEDAIVCYKKAVQIEPDYDRAHFNMGIAFHSMSNHKQAIASFKKVLQIKPNCGEAYFNMGIAFQALSNYAEAIFSYQQALKLKPNWVDVYNNLGIAYQAQGNLPGAISCYQKAIQINLKDVDAHNNLGTVLQEQGLLREAIACYQKALALKPDNAVILDNLVSQLQFACDWEKLESLNAKLDGMVKKALENGTKPAETPFGSLKRHADPARCFAIASSYGSSLEQMAEKNEASLFRHFSFESKRNCNEKITVGYLSGDFRDHAVSHILVNLFDLHNRDEFRIFCYSYGIDDQSYFRKRIKQDCDKFVDIRNLSYTDAARMIHKDQVDILVEMNGYTLGGRLGICAMRPAPIQVSYLGFLGTTGADFIDYIITDKIVTPEDQEMYYSEKFVFLPHCYQITDYNYATSEKIFEKKDFGLPEGSFVYCSFNQPYKFEPAMFNCWMKILQQVPNGVLWLRQTTELAEKNLKEEAKARGVESERMVFSERIPLGDHLSRLKLADLYLDTRLYNGGATTSNALWAGIPVITLQGKHFVSRMSSSSLSAIGLHELITHTLEDYEGLAVRLTKNLDELNAIRKKLVKNRTTEALFDTPRFVKNLESAYMEMWKLYLAGERPRQIEVAENLVN
jgi:protein O-GlcNAc transferase